MRKGHLIWGGICVFLILTVSLLRVSSKESKNEDGFHPASRLSEEVEGHSVVGEEVSARISVAPQESELEHRGKIRIRGTAWIDGQPMSTGAILLRIGIEGGVRYRWLECKVEVAGAGDFNALIDAMQDGCRVSSLNARLANSPFVDGVNLESYAGVSKGELDVGAVNFSTRPLLVSGNVWGVDGKPKPGVRLEVNYSVQNPDKSLGIVSGVINGKFLSDIDGYFEIRQRIDPSAQLTLRIAGRDRIRSVAVSCFPGETGVALILDTTNYQVQGRVLVDDEFRSNKLNVRIVCRSPGFGLEYLSPVSTDGQFRVEGVAFGELSLGVEQNSMPCALLYATDRINDALKEGSNVIDVGDVDLRGLLSLVDVRCVDETGSPIGGCSIRRPPLGGIGASSPVVLEHGTGSILNSSGLRNSLSFSMEGYLTENGVDLSDEATVQLLRFSEVELFSELALLIRDPYKLRLDIAEKSDLTMKSKQSLIPDESGAVRIALDPRLDYRIMQVVTLKRPDASFEGRALGPDGVSGLMVFSGDRYLSPVVLPEGRAAYENAIREISKLVLSLEE